MTEPRIVEPAPFPASPACREGKMRYVAPVGETDRTSIGRHMAGH